MRKTKPTNAPDVRPPAGPINKPVVTTATTVNTANTSPDGKRNAPMNPARMLLRARSSTSFSTLSIT